MNRYIYQPGDLNDVLREWKHEEHSAEEDARLSFLLILQEIEVFMFGKSAAKVWYSADFYKAWDASRWFGFFNTAAHSLEIDTEDLLNPANMTDERRDAVLKAINDRKEEELAAIEECLYRKALFFVNEKISADQEKLLSMTETLDPLYENDINALLTVRELTVIAFFALHKEEISPTEPGDLIDKDREELLQIAEEMAQYGEEHGDNSFFKYAAALRIDRLLDRYFEQYRKQKKISPKKAAEEAGAVVEIEKLLSIALPEIQGALNPFHNGVGLLRYTADNDKAPAFNLANADFLKALLEAMRKANAAGADSTAQIYMPGLMSDMGYDLRANDGETRKQARERKIHEFIQEMDSLWGKLPNDWNEYAVIAKQSYDPRTECLTMSSPYFSAIARYAETVKALESGKKKYVQTFPALMKPTSASCKNREAVKIAEFIMAGLERRGDNNADKKPYSVTWETLLDNCPDAVKIMNERKNKTAYLADLCKYVVAVLENHSFLYERYNEATVNAIRPTMRTLETSTVTITHKGKNTSFIPPQ